MAEKTSSVQELLEEVRAIRDAVDTIEKRTVYLRPSGIIASAGKQFAAGMLKGAGVLVGGALLLGLLGFIAQRTLSSDKVQEYIGRSIETAVTNSINKKLEALPFR
jgi:hypothetical protein